MRGPYPGSPARMTELMDDTRVFGADLRQIAYKKAEDLL
jgi:hypothetical protein